MSETIIAISGLWPLALVVLLGLGMVVFRRELRAALTQVSKVSVKRGQTEVAIETKAQNSIVIAEQAPATIEPPTPEEIPKALPEATSEANRFILMVEALRAHRFDDALELYEALQRAEDDSGTKLKNEVLYRSLAYAEGMPEASVLRIEEIAAASADLRAFALGWLGWAYSSVNALEQARGALSRAIAAATNDDERAQHRMTLARMLQQTGELDHATDLVTSSFGSAVGTETQVRLYLAVAEIFKDDGDKLMRAVALEKALELNPPDRDLRFSAAFAQSEADLPHLASTNYETLIEQDSKASAVAMNNLGVVADSLTLPIKAVALYRSSKDEGETLATANLAYKLLKEGFIDEARELLNDAKTHKDVHQNVSAALADASKRESAEEEKWKSILKLGAKHRLFLHAFAEARFCPFSGPPPFDGTWQARNGAAFEIQEQGDGEIIAVWGSGTERSLASLTGLGKRKLKGRRINRAFVGMLLNWNEPILAGSGHFDWSGPTALAYVSSDRTYFEVLSLDKNNPPMFRFEPSQVGSSSDEGNSTTL